MVPAARPVFMRHTAAPAGGGSRCKDGRRQRDRRRYLYIDGDTQLVGIVGRDIAYTMSPAIHNTAFSRLGMNWAYVPLRVSYGGLQAAVRGLCAAGFRGFNVTIPYKLEAARCVDELREPAGVLGAVNTVVCEGGLTIGYNTDVDGFRSFLAEAGIRAHGSSVLLIGAGGAARAVALALAREGAARVYVMNRSRERAEELAALLKRVTPATEISLRTFDIEGSRIMEECDLAVNCTPLAGSGADQVPMEYGGFGAGKWAIDLKYAKKETAFLAQASAAGAMTADGGEMLLQQAAASFSLWTGVPAPLPEMRDAYRCALDR